MYIRSSSNALTTAPSALTVLADWAASVSWTDLPPRVTTKVLDSLVDTVGVTIAGAVHEDFAPVRAFLNASSTTVGAATTWHDGAAMAATTAAYSNGTAGHLLDFDDVQYLIHGHPTTVLLPAVTAVAQDVGADGVTLLNGLVAGLGVMAAVARAFGPDHYTLGWHSTSTCGIIGAAAGAAVVQGLPADRIRNAMAIAVSRAAGVRANFGTLLKPMHAGFAARDAVEAALLSAHGVDAAPDPLQSAMGGLSLFGDATWDGDLELLLRDAAEAADGLGLKLYPCCRGSHYSVDAALDARALLHDGAVIERVDVVVPLGTKTALIYDDPQTGLEGKFSLPYTIATALHRGLPLVEHFDDVAVHEAGVRELMSRLHITQDDSNGDLSSTMTGRYAHITITCTDGSTYAARVDDARGSSTRPLTPDDVDTKFLGAVSPVRSAEGATALLASLRSLPTATDVRAIFAPR